MKAAPTTPARAPARSWRSAARGWPAAATGAGSPLGWPPTGQPAASARKSRCPMRTEPARSRLDQPALIRDPYTDRLARRASNCSTCSAKALVENPVKSSRIRVLRETGIRRLASVPVEVDGCAPVVVRAHRVDLHVRLRDVKDFRVDRIRNAQRSPPSGSPLGRWASRPSSCCSAWSTAPIRPLPLRRR